MIVDILARYVTIDTSFAVSAGTPSHLWFRENVRPLALSSSFSPFRPPSAFFLSPITNLHCGQVFTTG